MGEGASGGRSFAGVAARCCSASAGAAPGAGGGGAGGEGGSAGRGVGRRPVLAAAVRVGREPGRRRHGQKFPTMKSLKRPNAVFIEPLFCVTLKPRRRARRASSSRPITVAARGWATMSDKAPAYLGMPRRTGLRKMSSPSSIMPGIIELPPVSTMPEDSISSQPDSPTTSCTRRKISSTRAAITPASTCRLSMRGLRSPRPGTSTWASGSASSCLAQPLSTLMSSASLVGVRSAIAMSRVIRSRAMGITAVWRIAPPVKMATSVVPAPMSTTTTPSSRSSSVSTAWLDASGLSISCSTSSPQRRTHLMMFSAALCAPVTMWIFASRRRPLMPIGSFTSCPSITNSCGSTSSRRWSLEMLMALAVSITRATSAEVTSLSLTATMPLELRPRIWLPVMPVYTRWILQSAIRSASLSACWILCTVASMFTTTPRFKPLLGATPREAILSSPCGETSATTTMTLAVPMSRPTTTSLLCSRAISVSALVGCVVRCRGLARRTRQGLARRTRQGLARRARQGVARRARLGADGADAAQTQRIAAHMPQIGRFQRAHAPAVLRRHLRQRAGEALRALQHLRRTAAAEFDHGLVVQRCAPAATAGQFQPLQAQPQRLEYGLQQAMHLQHLGRTAARALQARQALGLDIADVGLEHLALAVDQRRAALGPPVRQRVMLLQLHQQTAGIPAPHLRQPHPGRLLEGRARGAQVDGEKVARQMRRHVGAQGHGIVVPQFPLHHDAGNGKARVAQQPPQQRCHHAQGAAQVQDRGGQVHQLDIQRLRQGLGHGHAWAAPDKAPRGVSTAAIATKNPKST